MASDLIRADMVEAIEFPHLANKYQVMGVPRTVFNETVHQEGAVPEPGATEVASAGLRPAVHLRGRPKLAHAGGRRRSLGPCGRPAHQHPLWAVSNR